MSDPPSLQDLLQDLFRDEPAEVRAHRAGEIAAQAWSMGADELRGHGFLLPQSLHDSLAEEAERVLASTTSGGAFLSLMRTEFRFDDFFLAFLRTLEEWSRRDRTPPTSRSAVSAPPTRVAGYAIESVAGRGGMGVVYRAMQVNLNRPVALKVLHERCKSDPSFLKRFRLEAQAAAKLKHPNVVQVYEAGTCAQSGLNFIAFEFVEGKPLNDVIREHAPFYEQDALKIVLGVANALSSAEEHGFVHRDIKPANILLTTSGMPKLSDLGLAKHVEEDTRLTTAGLILGTPHYMAPEQAMGQDVDIRADIYALGITLFHLVTGQLPYSGRTAVSLISQRVNVDVPDPRGFAKDVKVSDDVAALVRWMSARKPEERYPTAAELVTSIESVLAGELALRPSSWPDSAPPVEPPPADEPPKRPPPTRTNYYSETGELLAGGASAARRDEEATQDEDWSRHASAAEARRSARSRPSDRTPRPKRAPSPSSKTPPPGKRAPRPTGSTRRPSDRTPRPSDRTPRPSDRTTRPSDRTPRPSDRTPRPSDRTPRPSDRTPRPSDRTPRPTGGAKRPPPGKPRPSARTPRPTGGARRPTGSAKRPTGGAKRPNRATGRHARPPTPELAPEKRGTSESQAPRMILSDDMQRAYRVRQKLGEGSQGVVLLVEIIGMCEFADFERPVEEAVLKQASDPEGVAQEALIYSQTDHRVVKLLDSGLSRRGRPYLVLERLEPTPASRWSAANELSAVDPATAVDLFVNLLDRLKGLHFRRQLPLVLCDIKPENVMLRMPGLSGASDEEYLERLTSGHYEPVFTDLGCAQHRDVLREAQGRLKGLIGTPLYLPPESIPSFHEGEFVAGLYGSETDVYSLTLTFYSLITGRKPYEGTDLEALRGSERLNRLFQYKREGVSPVDEASLRSRLGSHAASVIEVLQAGLDPDPQRRATANGLLKHVQTTFLVEHHPRAGDKPYAFDDAQNQIPWRQTLFPPLNPERNLYLR